MARADKLVAISAAIDVIKRGEFANYDNAAKKYGCSYSALL
jgi:hypothetical protein